MTTDIRSDRPRHADAHRCLGDSVRGLRRRSAFLRGRSRRARRACCGARRRGLCAARAAGRAWRALSLSLVFGALFGFVLQRSRFCFFCNVPRLLDARDPRGLLGILVALAVGARRLYAGVRRLAAGSVRGRLPPDAYIGPVSIVLVLAGLAFGAGMAISGSCISAHLYRLGEGSPTAPFALLGTVAGFVLGFLTWNPLYLSASRRRRSSGCRAGSAMPARWSLALAVLGALALAAAAHPRPGAVRRRMRPAIRSHRDLRRALAGLDGGVAVGALGTVAYLRVAPLGVTAELGAPLARRRRRARAAPGAARRPRHAFAAAPRSSATRC